MELILENTEPELIEKSIEMYGKILKDSIDSVRSKGVDVLEELTEIFESRERAEEFLKRWEPEKERASKPLARLSRLIENTFRKYQDVGYQKIGSRQIAIAMATGYLPPSPLPMTHTNVLILLETSGSMSKSELITALSTTVAYLRRALRQRDHVLLHLNLYIGSYDTKLHNLEAIKIEYGSRISKIKERLESFVKNMAGGGGTVFVSESG